MDFLFVASVSVITQHPDRDISLYAGTIGMPLQAPTSVPGSAYRYSEKIEGTKHFGVWPLTEAAQACFGVPDWPAALPVPQATIEFEVRDVEAAAAELEAAGYPLVHSTRTEPWGQQIARLQSPDGLLLAVCHTPDLAKQA